MRNVICESFKIAGFWLMGAMVVLSFNLVVTPASASEPKVRLRIVDVDGAQAQGCKSPEPHGRWILDGWATKYQEQQGYYDVDHVTKEFKTCAMCTRWVQFYAHSDESIGTGGTNGRVPGLEWNLDATCFNASE